MITYIRAFVHSLYAIYKVKSYLFKKIYHSAVWIALLTTVICAIHSFGIYTFSTDFSLPGVMGAALGILLVFRNNTAYERWWEARKVLGGIVNTSRGLAIQLKVLVPDKEIRKEIISLVAAYFFVLKEHLREGVIMEEISFLPDADKTEIQKWLHKPNCVTNLLMSKIAQIYKAAHITDFQYMQLIGEVNLLIEYIGKCERIKNTPMPLAHKYLLKTYIFVYIMITPFGFVATMGWWTVLAVVAVYFLSVSIVTIADEIENPFGKDLSDLPVDGIAMNIRNNLIEIDEK